MEILKSSVSGKLLVGSFQTAFSNPKQSTLLGYVTWAALGSGRLLVVKTRVMVVLTEQKKQGFKKEHVIHYSNIRP